MKRAKPQTAERLEAVKKLYFDSWGRLRDDALQSNPNLTAGDAFDVVASLSAKLDLYPGHLALNEDAFAKWAASVLEATIFLHGLQRQCEPAVRRAIQVFIARHCGGLGVDDLTVDEIMSDTWLWALNHIDELRKPGTASLSTRLAVQAEFQAWAWQKKQVDEKNSYSYFDEMTIEERECLLQAVADSPPTPPTYLKAGASAVSPLNTASPLMQ